MSGKKKLIILEVPEGVSVTAVGMTYKTPGQNPDTKKFIRKFAKPFLIAYDWRIDVEDPEGKVRHGDRPRWMGEDA